MLIASARRALIWAGGATIISDLAQFGAMLVMVRLVSPAEYGQAVLAQGLYAAVAVFSFGTFVQHVLQFRDPGAVDWSAQLTGALTINVSIFLLCCGVAWLLHGFDRFSAAALPFLALSTTFILEIPGTLHLKYLQAHHEWARYRSLLLGGTFLGLVSGLLVAAMGGGVWAVVISTPLLIVPASIDYLLRGPHALGSPRDWRRYSGTLRFGFNRVGAALMSRGRVAVERGVISGLYQFGALGVYNRSNGLATILAGRIGQLVMQSVYPIVTRADAGSARFRRAADLVFRGTCWITIPCGLFLMAAADPVVRILYGADWLAVVGLLPAASAAAVATSLSQVVALLLLANNNARLSLLVDVGHGVIAIALIFIVLPHGLLPFLWALAATGAVACLVSFGVLCWRRGADARSLLTAALPPLLSSCVAAWAVGHLAGQQLLAGANAAVELLVSVGCFGLIVPLVHRVFFPRALSELLEVLPRADLIRALLLYGSK